MVDREGYDNQDRSEREIWLIHRMLGPKAIAALDGHEVKIVKVMGEFPWHHHEHEDELFLVWKGNLRVEFRDHVILMGPGDCLVVPRSVVHRTCAGEEAEVVCFEPKGLLNTGNASDEIVPAPNAVKFRNSN